MCKFNGRNATMKISFSLIHFLVFDDDDEFDSRLVSNEIVTNLWGTEIYIYMYNISVMQTKQMILAKVCAEFMIVIVCIQHTSICTAKSKFSS